MLKIAVVVPVFNRKDITLKYLEQMRGIHSADANLEIIIVDDGSTDGTSVEVSEQFPEVVVLNGTGDLWWSGGVDMGVRYAVDAGFNYILIMNDDLEFKDEFLQPLIDVAVENPKALVSSVTMHVENGEEEILTCGFARKGKLKDIITLYAGRKLEDINDPVVCAEMLTGASLLIPVTVFHSIGFFDVKKFPQNWGDLEFTLRAFLAGFPCLVATKSLVYTEFNPNYPVLYLYLSTRREYLKNLFDTRRFLSGFSGIYKTSFMHKPFLIGIILYIRRLFGLFRSITLKLFLSKNVLRNYLLKKALKRNAPDLLIKRLREN